MNIWKILEMEPTNDLKELKKSYAKLIAKYHPEEFPEKFQEIHLAYTKALDLLKEEVMIKRVNIGDIKTDMNNIFLGEINEETKKVGILLDEIDEGTEKVDIQYVEHIIKDITWASGGLNPRKVYTFFKKEEFVEIRYNSFFIQRFCTSLRIYGMIGYKMDMKFLDLIEEMFSDTYIGNVDYEANQQINIEIRELRYKYPHAKAGRQFDVTFILLVLTGILLFFLFSFIVLLVDLK